MADSIKNRVPHVDALVPAELARVMLAPAVLSNQIAPYVAVMAFGFLIGVFGHVIHSRMLIVTGIIIVGVLSTYVVFGLAKLY
jgi:hypothetical protein